MLCQQESTHDDSESERSYDPSEQQPCAQVDRALELLAAISKSDQPEVSRLAPLVFSSSSLSTLAQVTSKADEAMLNLEIIGRTTYGAYEWDDLHDMGAIRAKALRAAAAKNSLPMFQVLLRSVRRPTTVEISDAFETACREGSVAIVDYLVKHHESALRGSPGETIPPFRQGLAVAMESTQAAAVEIILSHFSVNVNVDFDYLTPNYDGPWDCEDNAAMFVYPRNDVASMCMLEHAIYSREALELLLARGLDLNRPVGAKQQHVLVGCCENYLCPFEVVRLLTERPDVSVDDAVLLEAVEKGRRSDKEEIRALIAARKSE